MTNQYCNHLIVNNELMLDLRDDDVTPTDVASGKRFHDASGAPCIGTAIKDISWFALGSESDKKLSSNSKTISFTFDRPAEGYSIISATITLIDTYTASSTTRYVTSVTRPCSILENAYGIYVHETAKSNYHVVYCSQATMQLTWSGSATGDSEWTVSASAAGFSGNVYFKSGSTYRCNIVWGKK